VRTSRGRSNNAENHIKESLEAEGWTVLTRGWPDFICTKGKEVKIVEVKARHNGKLSSHQETVIALLRSCGLNVEVIVSDYDGLTKRPVTTRAFNTPTPGLSNPGLLESRKRGEVHVFERKNYLVVSCPYHDDFRAGAKEARARYRPGTRTWAFANEYKGYLLELIQAVYPNHKLFLTEYTKR